MNRLLDTSNLHKLDKGFTKVNLNADTRPLRNIIHGPLNWGGDFLLLKDVCSLQNWHREVISFQLPPNLLSRIKATSFPIHANGIDHISWASSPSREFELKDAYRLARLNTDDSTVNPFVDNWVWKTNTMPKIKCFLWQCVHRSIPVREVLVARGLHLPTSCPLCNGPSKSIIRVLRDCSIAQQVWNSLSPPMLPNLFFGINLSNWLRLNCKS